VISDIACAGLPGTAASISTAAAARLKPRTRPATGFAIHIVRKTSLNAGDGSRTRHAMIRFRHFDFSHRPKH
jgi:hypothetical protein